MCNLLQLIIILIRSELDWSDFLLPWFYKITDFFPILSNTSFSWATSRWVTDDLNGIEWVLTFDSESGHGYSVETHVSIFSFGWCLMMIAPASVCRYFFLGFVLFDSLLLWLLCALLLWYHQSVIGLCLSVREREPGKQRRVFIRSHIFSNIHQVLLLLQTLSSFFGKLHHGIYPILNCCWFELAIWGRAIRQSAAACCQPKGMMMIT